ncbi:MAG: hypothetical protein AB1726_08435 [Planctomycetota bacterium]
MTAPRRSRAAAASHPGSATVLALLVLSLLAGCRIPRPRPDATIAILTPGAGELGVSTEYGIVFLGCGQQGGTVRFDAWFGGDPSREEGLVEAVGGGLYVTEAEIRLPTMPITFAVPAPGEEVVIVGRRGAERWRAPAVVAVHPAVTGLLLQMGEGMASFDDSQRGAGVYVARREGLVLLGLVAGTVSLPAADGGVARYLAVVGPEEMWRVATHARNRSRDRRWVYRDDVL